MRRAAVAGVLIQVNTKPKTNGERGLPKVPLDSAFIATSGVEGDFNVYRHEELQDDPDSALLILPIETIRELNSEGWPVKPGDLGENFTTSGIPYRSFALGRTFAIGDVRFQISRACNPCDNLFLLPYVGRQKGAQFLKATLDRRGWYARVLKEGRVAPGDQIAEGKG